MNQNNIKILSDMEYNSLRQEILEVANRELNLINFGVTATAAILAFAFNTKDPFIFLLPLTILYGTLTQLCNSLRQTLTVATYIRVCIESRRSDLNWESFVHELRTNLRSHNRYSPWMRFTELNYSVANSELNYAIPIVFLGIVCAFFSCAYASQTHEILVSICTTLIWIFFSARTLLQFRYAALGKYEKALETRFENLFLASSKTEQKEVLSHNKSQDPTVNG